MYIPSSFEERDLAKLHRFMTQYSFASLISHGEAGLFATHLPFLVEPEHGPFGRLAGHLARANPQWRPEMIQGEVMVVFSGPHAYISPSWYEAEEMVPTWNYAAVHAYGTFRIVEDPERLLEILGKSVQAHEGPRARPWSFVDSDSYIQKLMKGIVGFHIDLTRVEGKWKMSQNQPVERQRLVASALEAQGGEESFAVARLINERLGLPPSS
ncbi:FMN-binding negative transcriptional regulator [Singulisphaera sp. PoT]|uniref:FMN-binding negative transcriptional regulator n=1 Tax=Singulisphaera sp. PoT TaxID=3411797 RepID=UPI003BF4A660